MRPSSRLRWSSALVLSAFVLSSPVAEAASAEAPVAVMPFKNLNADAELEWLRAGIAETLLADLRKSGTAIVERDQLDKAMTEIALQGGRGTDESTAARVGRMTGARTVVVGAFQKAGKNVRITARFVVVETGVVQDTAKVTGPLTRIFHLQDEIVARLLGEPAQPPTVASRPKVARRRPAPPSGEKTLKAYRLYAMAVTTASDADRVGYLRQALDVDPSFTYAADDLAALERRLEGYREQGVKAAAQVSDDGLAFIRDGSRPAEERSMRAVQLLGELMGQQQYRRMEQVAREIIALGLPDVGAVKPTESAVAQLFFALDLMRKTDAALQAGENYLKAYPGGLYRQAVDLRMQVLIGDRSRVLEGQDAFKADMEELAAERARAVESAERRKTPMADAMQVSFDFRPCSLASRHKQDPLTIQLCTEFAKAWRAKAKEAGGVELVFLARWLTALAHANLGQFSDARALAKGLSEEDPKRAREMAIPMIANSWPRD